MPDTMKGDLYIHHADQLRSELRLTNDSFAASVSPLTPEAIGVSAAVLLFGLVAELTAQRRRRRP
jgi:hypothetical protein